MANYVTCDDCHKKAEGKSCPSGWFDIDLLLTQNFRSNTFIFFLCPDCYEKIVNPSPIGVLKRMLSFIATNPSSRKLSMSLGVLHE